jgi:hypothetical protein
MLTYNFIDVLTDEEYARKQKEFYVYCMFWLNQVKKSEKNNKFNSLFPRV